MSEMDTMCCALQFSEIETKPSLFVNELPSLCLLNIAFVCCSQYFVTCIKDSLVLIILSFIALWR